MHRYRYAGLLVAALLFLIACEPAWTEAEKQNAQYIHLAFRESQAATHLSNTVSGLVMAEDFTRIWRKHLNRAYEYAQIVDDGVLDKVHPEMRDHWRAEFLEGLRLRLLNAEPPHNPGAEIKGQALHDQFGDWWNANNKGGIKIPKA